MTPPFHVEHIGSFVRPPRLIEAARAHKAGRIDAMAFGVVQDECIRELVAFEEAIGVPTVTDGEFRRRSWSAGFIDAVDGFGLRDGTLGFRTETAVMGVASSPYAKAPLIRKRRIVADDYRFLKSVVKRGVPKVTMASPPVMHFFLGPKAFDAAVYRDREAYLAALTQIYRDEIAELAREGCTYLQLDDTALPCNCDASARADVAARGEDADALTTRYAKLINDATAARPAGMTVAIHLCRGNLKGAWMAEGGYEPIAEALFDQVNVDVFCLDPRPGQHQDAGARDQGRTAPSARRGGALRAARASRHQPAMRLLERRRQRSDVHPG
ncbi:MAG: 5-methyltetrahydropteroyltriglutamate--homocysteine S-methyltransferase [Proteobacteria bacterium]|nr:5-methyltetrahydropteroyltriglutamate--homocysteine S-methyltransferase [Pseudomonadota bacterium]